MKPQALVVLSGGQDSTTCAAIAVEAFGAENVHAITFDYNQRHAREILAARRIAHLLGLAGHEVITLGPILKGTSPLTNPSEKLETYSDFESMDKIIGDRVEKTFVPMRNALFLTIAANRAACLGAKYVYTGVCQADNANYPDCRLDFINAQQLTINEALGITQTKDEVLLVTPLMMASKAESIRMLWALGIEKFCLLAFSHTAYDGSYPPVSKDHANVLRAHGFEEADYPDPLVVRAYMERLMNLPMVENYRFLGDIPETITRLKTRLPVHLSGREGIYEPLTNEGSEA